MYHQKSVNHFIIYCKEVYSYLNFYKFISHYNCIFKILPLCPAITAIEIPFF